MGTRDLFDAIRTSSTGASERPTCVGHPGAMHGRLRDPVGAVHGVPLAPEVRASLWDGSFCLENDLMVRPGRQYRSSRLVQYCSTAAAAVGRARFFLKDPDRFRR